MNIFIYLLILSWALTLLTNIIDMTKRPILLQMAYFQCRILVESLAFNTIIMVLLVFLFSPYLIIDDIERFAGLERISLAIKAIKSLTFLMIVSALFWIIKAIQTKQGNIEPFLLCIVKSVLRAFQLYMPLIFAAGYFLLPINSFNGSPEKATTITYMYDAIVIALAALSITNEIVSTPLQSSWRRAPLVIIALIFSLSAMAVERDQAPYLSYLKRNNDKIMTEIERSKGDQSRDQERINLAVELEEGLMTLMIINDLSFIGSVISSLSNNDKSKVVTDESLAFPPYAVKGSDLNTGAFHYGVSRISTSMRNNINSNMRLSKQSKNNN